MSTSCKPLVVGTKIRIWIEDDEKSIEGIVEINPNPNPNHTFLIVIAPAQLLLYCILDIVSVIVIIVFIYNIIDILVEYCTATHVD